MKKKQKFCLKVCKSKCCNNAWIFRSPKELEKKYKDFLNRTVYDCRGMVEDIWLLFPMLEYQNEKRRDGKKFKYFYRCKFLRNGKCSIYKFRPRMCRNYGIKYKAAYPDCIYNKVKKIKNKD